MNLGTEETHRKLFSPICPFSCSPGSCDPRMKITDRHSISVARKNGNSLRGMSPTLQFSHLLKRAVFSAPNAQRQLKAGRKFWEHLADTQQVDLTPMPHKVSFLRITGHHSSFSPSPIYLRELWELLQASSSQISPQAMGFMF